MPSKGSILLDDVAQHLASVVRRRGPKPLEPDPEADARVDAFFKRTGIVVTRDDPFC